MSSLRACALVLFFAAGCATSDQKALGLQLRTWTGPSPRVGISVKLASAVNPAHEIKLTQRCRTSLGRYEYIVDPSSPVQVELFVGRGQEPHHARIVSVTRGVLADEALPRHALTSLCPQLAARALNALVGEGAGPAAAPVVVPTVAVAQPAAPTAPTPTDADAAAAKEHFKAATAYFTAKLYDRALGQYQLAYDKLPLPDTLYNIGVCHERLGHTAEAIAFLERFLTLQPNGPGSPDARAQLEKLRHRR